MKLARFFADGATRIGMIDVTASTVRPLSRKFSSLQEVMTAPAGTLEAEAEAPVPLSSIRLEAPIIPQRNIFCVGKNYRAHAKEFAQSGFEAGAVKGKDLDEYPAIFTKPPSTVIGPNDVVEMHPEATSAVDYEAELAVIIGRPGRNISADKALEHVWGYSIINDVTARDRQKNHKQWFAGKSLDTFCPMGPWAVTADEIDGENLDVACRVNGELRQEANTRDLIFTIPVLIATLSAGLTLQPGDVIATGTPAGVGIGFDPPRFLKTGDRVEITIAGIGKLENLFR